MRMRAVADGDAPVTTSRNQFPNTVTGSSTSASEGASATAAPRRAQVMPSGETSATALSAG